MALHRNRKGLNLPISGEPDPTVERARQPRRVALVASDYVGMKPTMHVREGDAVHRGQLLFEDKKTPGVRYTAPAEGRVVAVNRGAKRAFVSLVIELSGAEASGGSVSERYASHTGRPPTALDGDAVRELLTESGAWTALRARPFGRVANPAERPHSIFVTAADSNPLAPALQGVLAAHAEEFRTGVEALAALTDGPVFVCAASGTEVPLPRHERVRLEQFRGPHPSGTVGWHVHCLDPVDRNKVVWHLAAQDAVAFGHLFRTGAQRVERVISLAGPGVRRPRLLRTRLGASTDDLVVEELRDGEMRVVSGSVLSGRAAAGETMGFLGRYHQQIAVLAEDRGREFLGWLVPGVDRFSVSNLFASALLPRRRFAFTTSTRGSKRAIVPIGAYERVFPFDIPATFLMRSLAVGDVERAEELGCLELDEEDVALCTFVDPGKDEFGRHLRGVLESIWSEG